MKTYGDIDRVPYKYRGQRDAEAAFQKWREGLVAARGVSLDGVRI